MIQVSMKLTADEHAALRQLVRDGEYPSIAEVLRRSVFLLADERGLSFRPRERNRGGRLAGYRHRPETIAKMRATALKRAVR
jgi:Arc/MetJ-type ribon-helix-helix transcriptional regulator